MNDIDVRNAVHKKLLKRHHSDADTLVLDELGICLGACRVDIAVVNGILHGYELKSAKDTLERLPAQVKYYSAVMDKVTLVVSDNHYEEAKKIVPDWWGIKVVTQGSRGGIHIVHERAEKTNRSIDPLRVAQLLWKEECLTLLEKWGSLKGNKSKPRHKLWAIVSETIPEKQLRNEVRLQLKKRTEWRTN
ncbi:sce7726 family protein [Photobacterium galatheae]|uniref:Regulatory protein n=1 Tax=Photobacterium galatheae TaxID=1654360 RepID=A0A066RPZ3_9GAMM|nr:sce7726 family protein [Photobacterium galatheae]KDM89727.1 regulatory protein [Photobacterium galatheae]MCM0151521.1 sce7726 family protein [Photobacterium galatheae]